MISAQPHVRCGGPSMKPAPRVASSTPNQSSLDGRPSPNRLDNSAVLTTYREVRNADVEGSSSPRAVIWAKKPARSASPRASPAVHTSGFPRCLRTDGNSGRTAAASVNRDEIRKATTDVVPMRSKSASKASMISRIQMKVAPQTRVTNSSIHVARRRTADVGSTRA